MWLTEGEIERKAENNISSKKKNLPEAQPYVACEVCLDFRNLTFTQS